MPGPEAIPGELVREGERVMRLCNACRYCEGFCAVFPALERRLAFGEADLEYLANLCHNCGECYHACQYAPPQEFALNFPRTLAELRIATYRKYAWPAAGARLLRHGGRTVAVVAAAASALLLAVLLGTASPARFFAPHPVADGSFYAVMSHGAMVLLFGALGALACATLGAAAVRFWRGAGDPAAGAPDGADLARALSDALRLRYLDGDGDGCCYPDDVPSHRRQWFHHLTFYGFGLCFASTTVAAGYHYLLGRAGPYPLLSLPVVLGTLGGVGLVVGTTGLLWLKALRSPALVDPAQTGMDLGFLVLLLLTGASGLLLLGLRETGAMATLLAAHLGLVVALFVTLPYGKFVHGVHRFAALLRNAQEQRRPRPRFGAD